jgi:hypothetical protein
MPKNSTVEPTTKIRKRFAFLKIILAAAPASHYNSKRRFTLPDVPALTRPISPQSARILEVTSPPEAPVGRAAKRMMKYVHIRPNAYPNAERRKLNTSRPTNSRVAILPKLNAYLLLSISGL